MILNSLELFHTIFNSLEKYMKHVCDFSYLPKYLFGVYIELPALK